MKNILILIDIVLLAVYIMAVINNIHYATNVFFSFLLLKMAYYDYKTYIINNESVLMIMLGGIIYQLNQMNQNEYILFYNIIFALLFVSIVFLPLYFFTDSLGGGDVKLSYALCLWLPYPFIAKAILIAAVLASLRGLYLILIKKKRMNSMIAFGPFIAFGALVAFLSFN